MTIIFYLQFSNIDSYQNSFTAIIATPKTVSTIPVILLRRSGVALLANIAATLAPINVVITHADNANRSGNPPIIMCDTAPVKAVNVIMNTLVPTAVFNSYPSTLVRIKSSIMPPPAPIKPHINPIRTPQRRD